MDDSIRPVLKEMEDLMDKAIQHLKNQLIKIRAGKASPDMIDSVSVMYYGGEVPVNQVASVSVVDSRTLAISPWEKKMIPVIEKAIRDANLGINPSSDGDMVRMVVPPLTEDRRKQLVKQAKGEGEHAKVSVRTIRKDTNDELKKLQKNGVAEDAVKAAEKKVQDLTNAYTEKIDLILKEKEEQIMTV
ncbi:MAG: ribosome recycling factor [Bacteroidia bacterium]|nr:ribosome recycling factor [Bacteroidia bacterium]